MDRDRALVPSGYFESEAWELRRAWIALWLYEPEPDLPCDDLKCRSCYVQPEEKEMLDRMFGP